MKQAVNSNQAAISLSPATYPISTSLPAYKPVWIDSVPKEPVRTQVSKSAVDQVPIVCCLFSCLC